MKKYGLRSYTESSCKFYSQVKNMKVGFQKKLNKLKKSLFSKVHDLIRLFKNSIKNYLIQGGLFGRMFTKKTLLTKY